MPDGDELLGGFALTLNTEGDLFSGLVLDSIFDQLWTRLFGWYKLLYLKLFYCLYWYSTVNWVKYLRKCQTKEMWSMIQITAH